MSHAALPLCCSITPSPCPGLGQCPTPCGRTQATPAPPVLRPTGTPMPQRQLAYQAPTASRYAHA